MILRKDRMMISIGHKNFVESSYIDEVLTPHGPRAARFKRFAAEVGMLIRATDRKRVKSVIKLKTQHIVLSSLEPETIRSNLNRLDFCPACANNCRAVHPMEKNRSRQKVRLPSTFFLSHGELRQYPGGAPACSRVPFGKGGILFRDVICHSCSSKLARDGCRSKPWRSGHPCDPLSLLDL